MDPVPLSPSDDPCQARTTHQQLHLVVPNDHALAQGELGMDGPATVDAVGVEVELGYQVGQHCVIACRIERSEGARWTCS
jgi:hypothetical protein